VVISASGAVKLPPHASCLQVITVPRDPRAIPATSVPVANTVWETTHSQMIVPLSLECTALRVQTTMLEFLVSVEFTASSAYHGRVCSVISQLCQIFLCGLVSSPAPVLEQAHSASGVPVA
jgi:hypothetical protein